MQKPTASTIAPHDSISLDNQVTQCPQCETAFRVSEQQLQLASGRVRCGTCLQVFVAAQHWAAAVDQIAEVPASQCNIEPQDQNDDPHDASEIEPTPPKPQVGSSTEFSDAFLALDSNTPVSCSLAEIAAASEPEQDEEHWARQILEDEESSTREPRNELLDAILASPAAVPEAESEREPAAPDNPGYDQGAFASTESWMQELLGGEEDDVTAIDVPTTAADPLPIEAEPEQAYIPEIFRDKKKLIEGIRPDPLEMHWRRHISPWMRHGLKALAMLLAVTLLAIQYAWFNSEQLAHNPRYRPLLTRFCLLTHCALPAANDISRIKNSNLVVLKHPRTEGALLLDTILTNYASFEQTYPSLHVQFSDMQDQVVAARVFTPQEYLGGDLVGSTVMPVRRPIHLSLELVDPGERAVNYRIELLATEVP
jgi:predicted Zn finger-like uncharacterized protein